MANQIKYQVGFDIQQNDLNKLKSSLQQIKKINLYDIMKINNSDLDSASNALKEIQQDATKVENALNKAFNTKLNTINIQTFNKELSSSNLTIEKIHQSFSRAGQTGQAAFNNLSAQILNTNVQLRQSSKLLDSMATSMANTVKWGITSSIFNNMTGAIQKAYYYAKDLDQSLTDIRIVTGDSADQMERFAQTANGAAKDLGRSTLDYTKAALTFYQQGLSDTEVQARTEATLKAENITGIGAEMADYLTAVWNGFKVGAEDAEEYVDKLAAVADSTASDMGQLATAISKVASAANSVGVDIDQLNGQIATVIATTRQAPESVGVAFKTIYARINDIKAGTDEAQISLGNYSSKMAQLGFNVLDASGHLRDTGEVIEEIGGSWQDLSREQQIYLAQTMAGQRQYNNLIALFDNWDQYIQSVNTSLSAQGTLNEKNDRYLESLEAHMQQLGAEAERTYDILFDENSVKGWVDALGGALNIFNDFISGIGGGTNAFTYFGSLVVGIFNKQIAQAIQGVGTEINRFFANIQAFNSKQKIINQIKSGLQAAWAGQGKNLGNNALTAQAQAAEKTLAVQKGLTIEQQKQAVQIQKQIGLETQRTQDLKQKLADEQRENQLARDRLGLDAQEKQLNDQQLQDLQNKLIYYKQIQSEAQKLLSIFTQTEIAIEDENANEEKRNQLAQQFRSQQELIKQAYKDAGGTQQHFTELWQRACNEIQKGKGHLQAFNEIQNLIRGQTKETQEVIQAINTLLKNQTSNTQEQLQASQRVTKEYQNQNNLLAEQGKRTINLQTMIRGMSAAGQVLSAWAGAAKTFGDQMATAQQKANATISGIQGTISGIGMMFGPIGLGISTLVNGVISFVKEVTPLGDILENHFKTAQQRIDELNESISAVNSNDKTKNAQIGELESLVEEYQKLSEKAGDYGINLDKLTQQEQDRYHEITDTFAEYNDAVIAGYDEQGHAIVKGQDALKDTIEVLKQAKLQADKAALGDKGDFLNNIALRHENEKQSTYQALEDEENSIKQEFNNRATKNWDVDITQIRDNLDYFILDYQEKYQEVAEDIRNQIGPLTEEQSSFISESFQQSFLKLTEEIQAAANSGDIFLLQDAVQKASQFRDTIRNVTGNQSLFGDIYDSLFTSFSVSEEDEQNYLRKINEIHKNRQELDKQIAEQTYSPQDANALITGLQVYDNETWSIIEDGLKQLGLTPSGFVKQLSDLITEQNISTDINQVYDLIQQKAESYAQILVSYGSAIEKAEKDAVQDAKKIFEEDKTAKDLNQSILDSIQQYFLSDETIKSLLADSEQHPEYKEFLESLIKSIYNLDDVEISLDQSGNAVINTVKTQRDKINQEILDIFSDKTHQKIPEQLKEYFSNLTIDEDTLLAIKNAAADPEQTFGDLQNAFNWVKNFIKDVDKQADVQPIINKFNKISTAIERIQKGKDLTWQEKNGLAQALNLTPQKLAELNTNADWLQEITEKVYTTLNPDIPEQGAARKQAFADLYSDLQSLRQAYEHPLKGIDGVMKMTTQEFGDVWDVVYQKELDALNLDQAALQNWATNRGMIFDGVEKNTQKALNAYKIEKDAESLQKLAQTVKEAGDKVDTSSEEFIELQTQLQLLTGNNWTAQNVISMLDMIAAYTDDGVQKFQTYAEWLDYIKNNGPEQTSQMSAVSKYNQLQSTSTNLSGAYSALSTGQELTNEQSSALSELISKNQQLAELSKQHGINSKQFLNVLNQIVNATEQQVIAQRELAIQESKKKEQSYRRQINEIEQRYRNKIGEEQLQQIANIEENIQKTAAQRLMLQQQISAQWQKQADAAQNIDQLESAKFAGMDDQTFERNLDAAAGREAQSLGLDEDEVLDYATALQECADQSDDLADSLETDRDASLQLAIAGKRLTRGIKDLAQNFDQYNQQINSDNIEEQAQAFGHLRDAMGDVLNIDGDLLSKDFLTNNLQDMRLAAQGDIDAIDRLRQAAADDIIQQCLVELQGDEQVKQEVLNLSAQVESQLSKDFQLGVNLDDSNFIAKCNQLVQAANMTEQQIQAYFNSLGFDPKISYTEANSLPVESSTEGVVNVAGLVDIPYTMTATSTTKVQVPKIESLTKTGGGSHSGAITNAPVPSSSGEKGGKGGSKGGKGGKGGGKGQKPDKSKKDLKKPLEDQRDLYHDINIQLEQTERNLDRIQKMQDRLYGKQLLDNLAKQKKLLEQQREILERKQKIQQDDLKQQQQTLKNLGVTFDQYGNITNYMDIIGQKQNKVNALIAEENKLIKDYNNTTKKEAKEALSELINEQQKKVKNAEDDLKKTQDKIKGYDKLREDIEDVVDQIEELTQQEIELNIKEFRMEVQIRLELGEAERDWNKFRKQVLEKTDFMDRTNFDDIFAGMSQNFNDLYSYFDVHGSAGTIETLTNQLLNTRKEIEQIDSIGKSAIYGDNKAKAMQDLQNDLKQLMEQMEDIEKLIDDIDQAYLDTIDDVEEQFGKQIEDYEYINELVQHNMDLLSLLYGDKNYDAMNRYYQTLQRNNINQLDSLKRQRSFWKQQWDAAVARGDTNAAEKFKENYKKIITDLNKLIEQSAKTIQEKYSNSINKIFDELDKKLSNGRGTDYLQTQWDLINKNADEYLDTINAAFAVQQTERKYKKILDDTKSIKNQQALKKLMNEQLDILKNKEKISQYDVDRAEKVLQLEQARIALEQAQAAKTSLRLKRDAQGNYSYQYAADSASIDDAQSNYDSAFLDLHNLDADQYKTNQEKMLSAYQEYIDKRKEIFEKYAGNQEEQIKRVALLDEEYGEYVNDRIADNFNIRLNLMESTFKSFAHIYQADVANYQQMAEDEKQILMENLVPTWNTGIEQMAETIAGEGGLLPACEQGFEAVTDATHEYQDELDELATAAGINLDDVQQGIDDTAEEFENLVQKNDDLLLRMNEEIDTVGSLREAAKALATQYEAVYTAAKQAASAIHEFIQAQQKAAAVANGYDNSGSNNINYNNSSSNNSNSSNNRNKSSSNSKSSGNSGGSGGNGGSGSGTSGSSSSNRSSSQGSSYVGGSGRRLLMYYATGGYTGEWGDEEGRLAFLHQKELVLNKEDTKNILHSVDILRNLVDSAKGNIFTKLSDINRINTHPYGNSINNELEQDVHIEANFPNVNSKREIEEAFSDLVNLATQRAMR